MLNFKGTGGHDSTEDALTCIQLLKWREKFEEKIENGWYSNQDEAKERSLMYVSEIHEKFLIILKHKLEPCLKEAIRLAVRVKNSSQFSEEANFRNLLKELKVKLAWENTLFMWFR